MAIKLIEVNLLPAEYRVVRRDLSLLTDRRVIWSTVGLMCVVVGLAIAYTGMAASIANKEANISRLRTEIAQYDTVKVQITQLEELKAAQEAKNVSLRSISVSKNRWVRILEDINASLPPHTWVVSIKEGEVPDRITLVCRTFVFQEVPGFMVQLERRPWFVAPELESIEQIEAGESGKAFAFIIHSALDPAIHTDTQPSELGPEVNPVTTAASIGGSNAQ